MVRIIQAETEEHFRHVRKLIAEYIAWDSARTSELGLDPQVLMAFQYDERHQALPGEFAPPRGCLLLATSDAEVAGCGAFQPLTPDACEMKRVYVRPEFRGQGIGRRLATTLISTATEAGYTLMRLETVAFMDSAIALYESLGFRRCEPYYQIPVSFRAITVFMALHLRRPGLPAA